MVLAMLGPCENSRPDFLLLVSDFILHPWLLCFARFVMPSSPTRAPVWRLGFGQHDNVVVGPIGMDGTEAPMTLLCITAMQLPGRLVTCPCAFRLRSIAQKVLLTPGLRHFSCIFPDKACDTSIALPCAFRLRKLAQNVWRSRMKCFLWHVQAHFHCAGWHKTYGACPHLILCRKCLWIKANIHLAGNGTCQIWRGSKKYEISQLQDLIEAKVHRPAFWPR